MKTKELKELKTVYINSIYRDDARLITLNDYQFSALLFQLNNGHFNCTPFSTKSFKRYLQINDPIAKTFLLTEYTLTDFINI